VIVSENLEQEGDLITMSAALRQLPGIRLPARLVVAPSDPHPNNLPHRPASAAIM